MLRAFATRGTWDKSSLWGDVRIKTTARRGDKIDRNRRRRILFFSVFHIAFHALGQRLAGWAEVRAHGVRRVVRRVDGLGRVLRVGRICSRRPAVEISVVGEDLPDQGRTDRPCGLYRSGCPCAWRGNITPAIPVMTKRIHQASDQGQGDNQGDGRTNFFQHDPSLLRPGARR